MTDPCEASDYFPLVAAKAGGALHDKCLFGIHDVTNRCDEIDGGQDGVVYRDYAKHFCCRTPDHEFCECYNTTREDGKFCGYAAFENWNGCSKVNARYKELKESLPEAYTAHLTPDDKKCLAQVCVGDNASKYLPREILNDCKDLQICSIDVEILGTMTNSEIKADCNNYQNDVNTASEEAMALLAQLQQEIQDIKDRLDSPDASDADIVDQLDTTNAEKNNSTPVIVSSIASILVVLVLVLFMNRRSLPK
tara:strand:- start:833 stop:1585 length:753 start_codon:yes stop_codon:yes gene_type:complete